MEMLHGFTNMGKPLLATYSQEHSDFKADNMQMLHGFASMGKPLLATYSHVTSVSLEET